MSTATTMNTSSEPKFQKTLQIKVQNPIRSHLKLLTNTKTFIVNYFPLDSEKIQISADLSSTLTVARAIASFIRAINEILPAKSFPLKIETKNYALHFCKKNGIAKEDLPALDSSLILGEIEVNTFCLKEKEEKDEDSDAMTSMESATSGYQNSMESATSGYRNSLSSKKDIAPNFQKNLKLEKKGFWSFIFCRC